MKHDFKPPEHSFLDSMGRRYIRLDVDIMTCNGMRYFTTFRTQHQSPSISRRDG